MLKVGIIGGGFGLNVQAPIIHTHPNMTVTAVSTVNRHQLPKEIEEWDHPPVHYKNWNEMIDNEELDLLLVSSMPIYHYEMVKYALQSGMKNIICEKPFTCNRTESEELVKLSKEKSAKLLLDFEWRYVPARQKVKELIQNNHIGEILHFEYHVSNPQFQRLQESKRGWLGQKGKSGGMLGALGSHMIDTMRWLIDDKIEAVNGFVHTHVPEGGGEVRDADDAFFINGKMKHNSTFSLQLVTGVNHGFGSSVKVYGTEGTITLDNDKQVNLGKVNEQLNEVTVPKRAVAPDYVSERAQGYFHAFYPYLESVYEYVVHDSLDPSLATAEDGHESQIVIDQIIGN
ncbi:gfo/Idh/MocA family oxidoreductase [Ornithinibacillus sp. L9]|uniref:Gfo/Idh/MocA family oxidoreductase n=1 Tax=Ornithinibacillus caprae TaxID=2678566 RepID=A0A6N8FEL0_9BACI|nr:Gfo/Idh/MocA family oxidoreductase [Ornithinibacillus caprae]MUK87980.1 gfo/Idh/MocA family oxidoreductase [Ornithinibacillus caprae]